MVARRDLLPPYLQSRLWQDLADCVDEVWGQSVDTQITALGRLRESILTNSEVYGLAEQRVLINPNKYDTFDPTTEMLRLSMLGLQVTSPDFLTSSDLNRLNQHLGTFWYSKGLYDFIDFIGYCLNVTAKLENLWTQDYIDFVPEGQQGISIQEGGTWFPTTHVKITFDPSKYLDFPAVAMVQLFYDIANYNLVLQALVSDTSIPIVGPRISMAMVTTVYHVFPGNIVPFLSAYVTPPIVETQVQWIGSTI